MRCVTQQAPPLHRPWPSGAMPMPPPLRHGEKRLDALGEQSAAAGPCRMPKPKKKPLYLRYKGF